MLLKFLRKIVGTPTPAPDPELLEYAHRLVMGGDNRAGIKAYRAYLETDPSNVYALNGLAAGLADIGDTAQAAATFELAYSLDDTFIPAMVNHAKLLNDHNRSDEAVHFLRRAKICHPVFTHTDAVYAGICLKMGQTPRARAFQLKAWLGNFDNLRLANCHLFWAAYDDVPETLIAAEHRFWAETVLPPVVDKQPGEPASAPPAESPKVAAAAKRVRIGYWSPDFRSHSVRFFFRPLLEAHDTGRFEVFLYHDFPKDDGHTEAIRAAAEHFHSVFELSDADLCELMRSHDLDVLVELAGHTSNNRVSLLSHRMARVQITALGYPPTTGLASVDAKLLDRYCSTPDDRFHYSEQPLVLPTSFWCFDPKEPVDRAAAPPVDTNGFITFGCVGNIAKITARMLTAWGEILAAVPRSRLLIRSISFEDPAAFVAMEQTLANSGLPRDRVDLKPPAGGVEFFRSYNEIDIILDTFPFNGGTTTCFAAHMGVPVVTLTGSSLLTRMGLSIMSNVEAGDLAVSSLAHYVERAVALAGDLEYLRRFRREIGDRLLRTGLGNAQIFTREFEQACLGLLEAKAAGAAPWRHDIAPLPAEEIVRRAYSVLRTGQTAAAQRIVDYCLREYPLCGTALMFRAQQLASSGRHQEALDYLRGQRTALGGADRVSVDIAAVRYHLLLGQGREASELVGELASAAVADRIDAQQIRLYRAAVGDAPAFGASAIAGSAGARRAKLLVPCDDLPLFERLRAQFASACPTPPGWTVEVRRCSEAGRIAAYRAAMDPSSCDLLVIAQKNVRFLQPEFWLRVDHALHAARVVGFAGCTRWARLDWRLDEFEAKAGCLINPSSEQGGMTEVQFLGPAAGAVCPSMAVLDGSLLAMRVDARGQEGWDEDLLGSETLLEEAWSHRQAKAGVALAVHLGLGISVDPAITLDISDRAEARMHCAKIFGFEAFATVKDDHMAVSVPVPNEAQAILTCDRFLGSAA